MSTNAHGGSERHSDAKLNGDTFGINPVDFVVGMAMGDQTVVNRLLKAPTERQLVVAELSRKLLAELPREQTSDILAVQRFLKKEHRGNAALFALSKGLSRECWLRHRQGGQLFAKRIIRDALGFSRSDVPVRTPAVELRASA